MPPLALVAAAVHLVPARVDVAPEIDGVLGDDAWRAATPSSAFTQKFPDEGAAPTERTVVRIAYDDDAIYVGVRCDERTSPVVARLTRRDRSVESDRITIDLDTRGDRRTAFHFEVGAAGVQGDGVRYDDVELSTDWDENWEARTRVDDGGWTAEVRIPLGVLRFDARRSQTWGLQVRRHVAARQEDDEWAFIPRASAGEVSRYGTVGPFEGLRPAGSLELRPFVLGRVRHRDPSDETRGRAWDVAGSAGLDLRWRATPDLTVDVAVLPDFAQVEADEVVLNLERYELVFPEKRPFFLEGLDAFATPVQVLYTRRIGAAPDLPALPDGETPDDFPGPSPIWGAVKLVGRPGGGLTLGYLSALTGPERVDAVDAAGVRRERVADPLTLFQVLRLRQSVGSRAHVGLVGAETLRVDPTGEVPVDAGRSRCPDGSSAVPGAECFHDAYVLGIDWRWRSPAATWVTYGQVLGSLVDGGSPRAIEDGTTIRSGDVAPGALFFFGKEGGFWRGDALYEVYGRTLELSDAGYLRRANLHHVFATIGPESKAPGRWTLDRGSRFEYFTNRNLDGLDLGSGYQLNTFGTLRGFWSYFVEVHFRPAHYDDRETGDGTALEREGLVGLELEIETDPRRVVAASAFTTTQWIFGGMLFDGEAGVTLHVLPQLDLELLPEFVWTTGEPRFVATGASPGIYVFGREDATAIGTTLRATYTFTPRLSLQAYGQLFLARGRFDRIRVNRSPEPTIEISDLVRAAPPATSPDFEETVLQANVVLRWEWRLGSTVYVVYTRSQEGTPALSPDERPTLDVAAATRSPAVDVVLVKVSYFWG